MPVYVDLRDEALVEELVEFGEREACDLPLNRPFPTDGLIAATAKIEGLLAPGQFYELRFSEPSTPAGEWRVSFVAGSSRQRPVSTQPRRCVSRRQQRPRARRVRRSARSPGRLAGDPEPPLASPLAGSPR
jgi:hypothetical protein